MTGDILRGSLFERTVRHTSGCTICAGGGGHPLRVLTTSYAGGRTRQFSLRRDNVVYRPLGEEKAISPVIMSTRKGDRSPEIALTKADPRDLP